SPAPTLFALRLLVPFLFFEFRAPRDLHSFPTRRSSDLTARQDPAEELFQSSSPGIETESVQIERMFQTGNFWLILTGFFGIGLLDRKSTRLNSSHVKISYAVFCLKKKNK